MAYTNLKTFVAASLKPYIVALRRLYGGQVDYMLAHLLKQEASIASMQAQVAKLTELILKYENDVVEYEGTAQYLQNHLYTSDQVSSLERRARELEQICLELYSIVSNRIPDVTLPDFDDVILPDDPVPTAAELEAEWRELYALSPDEELDQEQTEMLTTYITQQYEDWPRPYEYPTPPEPQEYWSDEELRNQWYEKNGVVAGTGLTETQRHELQSYLDFYQYTVRILGEQENQNPST